MLRILGTSDLHGYIWPFDYDNDRAAKGQGLAALAPLIHRLRQERPGALLVDNGDFLQGSALADHGISRRGPSETHPVVAAMNAVGYDAVNIGNHEFNFGLAHLCASVSGFDCPVVSCNIVRALGADPLQDHGLFAASASIDRMMTTEAGTVHPIRIGVVGAAPSQIADWDRVHVAGHLSFRPIPEAMLAHATALRAEGCDVIVGLCHSGLGRSGMPAGENVALVLAESGQFDAVIAGHTHERHPDPTLPHIPGQHLAIAQPGAYGSHLGVIDLQLEWRGVKGWTCRGSDVRLYAAPGPEVPPDKRVLDASRQAHRAVRARMNRRVATLAAPLHHYFANVANAASTALVAEAQRSHVVDALHRTNWGGMPVLSATAPFKLGSGTAHLDYTDIPAGPFRNRHVAALSPFPNAVTALLVDGALLRRWLERSARMFHRITVGSDGQMLHRDCWPAYNFDVIHGLQYQIDLSAPVNDESSGGMRRIRHLTHEGRPVNDDDRFVVAATNYRAGGGGGFAMLRDARRIHEGERSLGEILAAYARRIGHIEATARPVWSFAPLPGTSVVFRTGPGAMRHLAGVADRKLTPEGVDSAGQLLLRLDLS